MFDGVANGAVADAGVLRRTLHGASADYNNNDTRPLTVRGWATTQGATGSWKERQAPPPSRAISRQCGISLSVRIRT